MEKPCGEFLEKWEEVCAPFNRSKVVANTGEKPVEVNVWNGSYINVLVCFRFLPIKTNT